MAVANIMIMSAHVFAFRISGFLWSCSPYRMTSNATWYAKLVVEQSVEISVTWEPRGPWNVTMFPKEPSQIIAQARCDIFVRLRYRIFNIRVIYHCHGRHRSKMSKSQKSVLTRNHCGSSNFHISHMTLGCFDVWTLVCIALFSGLGIDRIKGWYSNSMTRYLLMGHGLII